MTLTTPQSDRAKKAQEASRTSGREFFVVAWQPLPSAENGAKSAHFVEVMNQDGEVIEAGMGDDLEDSILEIAPSLLPDWRTPPETS